MNTDKASTVAGAALAGIVAANVDYGKAISGDKAEIGKIIGAAMIGLLGWLQNRPSKPKRPKPQDPPKAP